VRFAPARRLRRRMGFESRLRRDANPDACAEAEEQRACGAGAA
jgi:hypothetical protein